MSTFINIILLLLKIRFWKVYVSGSKKGDFNWCRFWAKNRLVIWCCGITCQEVFNFIQIEIDPGYNVLKTVWKWMSLYKWPLYNLFWPFFHHMYVHLSQNWGSNSHFKVLNRSYLWLVQNLWQKMKIFPFLFFFQFCTKTEILIFCVFCILVFFVITFAPIKI